jgi:TPR repeat protein
MKALDLAAERGNQDAMLHKAFIHQGKREHKEAFTLFQKLANKGHPEGLWHEAKCFEEGKGVTKDHEKAIDLYTMSACSGNTAALEDRERLTKWNLIECQKRCNEAIERNKVPTLGQRALNVLREGCIYIAPSLASSWKTLKQEAVTTTIGVTGMVYI